jgi:hypothetical protein
MKRNTSAFLIASIILVSLVACHGKKHGPDQASKAVITLSITGSVPAGTLIGSAQATVNLPTGVTAQASPSSANPNVMETNFGIVTASGQATGAVLVFASYIASSATSTMSKVEVNIVKSSGFSTGEFAVANCDIAAGNFPTAADFTVTDFKAVDLNGAALTGLTVGYTVALQ